MTRTTLADSETGWVFAEAVTMRHFFPDEEKERDQYWCISLYEPEGMADHLEVTEFAELILRSPRIEDKLFTPTELIDSAPTSSNKPPELPARLPHLRLDDPTRAKPPPPRAGALHQPRDRGHALHYFANHELLAIELMALCLLKFPDAPTPFRTGVIRTLKEEQVHLNKYIQRMIELGVELGDIPVSGHFWKVLSKMKHPLDYVTGMSMVFEQANLDYASAWAQHFRECDDHETAELMDEVLEDEIGHVKHGVVWFNRWRPQGEAFDQFEAHLPEGLTPIRARGGRSPLVIEPRKRAGLSESFIEKLRVYRGSRGRRPRLWVFWPDIEEHIAGTNQPSRIVEQLTADLAANFGFLGANDDLVWVPNASLPSPAFTHRLAEAGLSTPKRVHTLNNLQSHMVDEVVPWGWSTEVRRRLKSLKGDVRIAFPEATDKKLMSKAAVHPLRAHFIQKGWLSPDRQGTLIHDTGALTDLLSQHPEETFLVKALYSSSGRHRRKVAGSLNPSDMRWVAKQCAQHGGVWVEAWLDRVLDFSVLVSASRKTPTLLRFLTDDKGAYRGHLLTPPDFGISYEVGAPIWRFPGGLAQLTQEVAKATQHAYGLETFGVDMLIERRSSGEHELQPFVEVNARYTMGHIAANLRNSIRAGRVALWWHIRAGDLKAAQIKTFAELAARWPKEKTEAIGPKRRRLVEGIMPTVDPDQATTVMPVLAVAPSIKALIQLFRPLDLSLRNL